MRYFSITTLRVRPGHTDEYLEARKINVDAYKRAHIEDFHSAFYAVTSGMPIGTYLLITPMKSLAELDPNPARTKAIEDARGEENNKRYLKLIADSITGTERSVYAFSAKMSYVPKEFAKVGGEFWTTKLPARAPAKKPAAAATADKSADKKPQ